MDTVDTTLRQWIQQYDALFHGAHLSQHGQDLAAWVPRGNGIDEIGPSYVYVKRWKGYTRGNAVVNKVPNTAAMPRWPDIAPPALTTAR